MVYYTVDSPPGGLLWASRSDLGKMLRKLEKNASKYPVDKSKGSNKKYDELQ